MRRSGTPTSAHTLSVLYEDERIVSVSGPSLSGSAFVRSSAVCHDTRTLTVVPRLKDTLPSGSCV